MIEIARTTQRQKRLNGMKWRDANAKETTQHKTKFKTTAQHRKIVCITIKHECKREANEKQTRNKRETKSSSKHPKTSFSNTEQKRTKPCTVLREN